MQTLLYDRIHGFWSPGSQVRPADLEPSRTCRHASGNVSIPAAVRVLIKLVQLMSHRARVQKLYLSMVQTELVAVRTNSQHRRRRSVVNMHGSVPMSSADAALAAGSIRPQRVTPHLSKQLSLVQHSSLVQLVQQSPMLEARPTAEAVESSDASATGWSGCCRGGSARHDAPEKLVYHPAALQVFSTAQLGPAACLCTHRKSFEDADSSQWLVHGSQHVCPDAVDTETCSSDDGGDRDCHGRAVGEAAGDGSVLSDVHESGFTNDLPMRRRVASMTKGSRGAKLSMGMRQSSLLRIPLSMELMDGWTAGLELELASTAVEVLDRFGVSAITDHTSVTRTSLTRPRPRPFHRYSCGGLRARACSACGGCLGLTGLASVHSCSGVSNSPRSRAIGLWIGAPGRSPGTVTAGTRLRTTSTQLSCTYRGCRASKCPAVGMLPI